MKTRVITSVVGLAVLALVLCFFDTLAFNFVLAAIALVAIHEVYDAFGLKAPHVFAAYVPLTLLVMLADQSWAAGLLWPALYVMAVYLACCVIARPAALEFAKVGGMAVLSGVILACFASLLYLRSSFAHTWQSIYAILLALGFAWGGDTFAYLAGSAFGKHKLAPTVSPHKTVEGAVGGLAGSVMLGVVITAIYAACGLVPAPLERFGAAGYAVVAVLGAVGSVLGMLGDLNASVVKRQCGIKDYGTMFPGHGGIMDRFDSVMFVAPFVAVCLTQAAV